MDFETVIVSSLLTYNSQNYLDKSASPKSELED